MVNDGWTDLIDKMINQFQRDRDDSNMRLEQLVEMGNFEKMEENRARADEFVEDDEVAEKLTPYNKMFCRRPTSNVDQWLFRH
jgi:hypothetical protein